MQLGETEKPPSNSEHLIASSAHQQKEPNQAKIPVLLTELVIIDIDFLYREVTGKSTNRDTYITPLVDTDLRPSFTTKFLYRVEVCTIEDFVRFLEAYNMRHTAQQAQNLSTFPINIATEYHFSSINRFPRTSDGFMFQGQEVLTFRATHGAFLWTTLRIPEINREMYDRGVIDKGADIEDISKPLYTQRNQAMESTFVMPIDTDDITRQKAHDVKIHTCKLLKHHQPIDYNAMFEPIIDEVMNEKDKSHAKELAYYIHHIDANNVKIDICLQQGQIGYISPPGIGCALILRNEHTQSTIAVPLTANAYENIYERVLATARSTKNQFNKIASKLTEQQRLRKMASLKEWQSTNPSVHLAPHKKGPLRAKFLSIARKSWDNDFEAIARANKKRPHKPYMLEKFNTYVISPIKSFKDALYWRNTGELDQLEIPITPSHTSTEFTRPSELRSLLSAFKFVHQQAVELAYTDEERRELPHVTAQIMQIVYFMEELAQYNEPIPIDKAIIMWQFIDELRHYKPVRIQSTRARWERGSKSKMLGPDEKRY